MVAVVTQNVCQLSSLGIIDNSYTIEFWGSSTFFSPVRCEMGYVQYILESFILVNDALICLQKKTYNNNDINMVILEIRLKASAIVLIFFEFISS